MNEKQSYCRAETYYKCRASDRTTLMEMCVGYIAVSSYIGSCRYLDSGCCYNNKLWEGKNAVNN